MLPMARTTGHVRVQTGRRLRRLMDRPLVVPVTNHLDIAWTTATSRTLVGDSSPDCRTRSPRQATTVDVMSLVECLPAPTDTAPVTSNLMKIGSTRRQRRVVALRRQWRRTQTDQVPLIRKGDTPISSGPFLAMTGTLATAGWSTAPFHMDGTRKHVRCLPTIPGLATSPIMRTFATTSVTTAAIIATRFPANHQRCLMETLLPR
ncbi:Uncharacterized protein PBTT_06699 [Plasmodiophora brassicae]